MDISGRERTKVPTGGEVEPEQRLNQLDEAWVPCRSCFSSFAQITKGNDVIPK